MPSAVDITVAETLALLDGPFSGLSDGVAQAQYALWLGSGISRNRVIDLNGVLSKAIEFLRSRTTAAADCAYRAALEKVIAMAAPTAEERSQIALDQPATSWACLSSLLERLWRQYSTVLSIELPDQKLDYLLWVGLDFSNTFVSQSADAEHLAIAMLVLEGAVSEIATANWDGLLEAAMAELGHSLDNYLITVTGEDLRGPAAAAKLYKFHGCALRAVADEDRYRSLLVARSAQITSWKSNNTFKIVRDQLCALVQRSRTLMIGMSAQDENIKHLFGLANAEKGWKWTDAPAPIIFAAEQLGDDQRSLLNVAYGEADYEVNRETICEAARIRAYGKPLLIALLLNVLTDKLKVLASDVQAPMLDHVAHDAIADGLRYLRDLVAQADDADRLVFLQFISAGFARARLQLQNGVSPKGTPIYFPIDTQPAHLLKGKLALQSSGQREAAAALGLIAIMAQESGWKLKVDDPALETTGALHVMSANGNARVFLVANDDKINSLMECGAFDEGDDDVVVICSGRVIERQQRNPSRARRDGSVGSRFFGFGPMLSASINLDDLRDRFRGEVAL